MKAKKLLCAFLLLALLPFYVMLAVVFDSSGTKGDVIADANQAFTVSVTDGVVNNPIRAVDFSAIHAGTYLFNVDYTVEEPGFYTGVVVKGSDGKAIFYFGAFSITGFVNEVNLPEGKGTLELHFMTSDRELRDFCAEYPIFSEQELETITKDLNFDSFTKTGDWETTLRLTVTEMVSAPGFLKYLVIAFSIVLAFLAFLLCTMDRPTAEDDEKTRISSLGTHYAFFALSVVAVQFVLALLIQALFSSEFIANNNATLSLLLTIACIDVFGFSFLYFTVRKIPATPPEKRPFGFKKYLLFVLFTAGLTGLGFVIGLIVHGNLAGNQDSDLSALMMNSSMPLRVLTVGILAPIFEELIFRKLLIDRLIKHGEFVAIFLSGLAFGLYHGNFQQFFFTLFVGWLWAFVYVRTGNVRNSIFLHMTMNMSTSIISVHLSQKYLEYNPEVSTDPAVLTKIMQENPDALLYFGLYSAWIIILIGGALIGFIVFLVYFCSKKFRLLKQENEPSRGQTLAAIFTSPYLWLFLLCAIGKFIETYLPFFLT